MKKINYYWFKFWYKPIIPDYVSYGSARKVKYEFRNSRLGFVLLLIIILISFLIK